MTAYERSELAMKMRNGFVKNHATNVQLSDIRVSAKAYLAEQEQAGFKSFSMFDLVKKICDEYDFTGISDSFKEMFRSYVVIQTYVVANEHGYASVYRRKGLFMNIEKCDEEVFLDKMIENTNRDIDGKKKVKLVKETAKAYAAQHRSDIEGQHEFVIENGRIEGCARQQTVEEYIEKLTNISWTLEKEIKAV